MAVLIEAFSVLVRRDSIENHFTGGWRAFLETIPNWTCCYEEELVRVGFMDPGGVRQYIDTLVEGGLVFLNDGKAVDIVVCDQHDGPTTTCDWIEFGKLHIGDDTRVSAAWLFEGTKPGFGLHIKGTSMQLAVPEGWQYEGSLSQGSRGQHMVDDPNDLEFLREEDGVEVYWHKALNREVFVGRRGGGEPLAPKKLLS
jgi:hypothetical protein